jgi:hypothetical protein
MAKQGLYISSKGIHGIFLLMIISVNVYGQQPLYVDSSQANRKDFIDIMRYQFGKTSVMEMRPIEIRKVQFSLFPSIAASGGDKGLVTAFVTSFYLGDRKTTNMSNVYFTPYFTFSKQFVFPIRTYIWTNNNKWNFNGDYRYMIYPQEIYGVGPHSNSESFGMLDYNQLRFYQNVLHGIFPNLAVGPGIQYDYYHNISYKQYREPDAEISEQIPTDLTDKHSLGATLEMVFDNRRNTINPLKGEFVRAVFRYNLPADNVEDWMSVYLDLRKYVMLNREKHRVLAFWGLYWAVFNGIPFYLDMPSNGWDYYNHTARGIQRNRYRSTSLIYLESEYRSELTENGLWGMVLFTNVTAPSTFDKFDYPNWYGSFGGGLRFKYNKFTQSNMLFDMAFSSNYWTWYFGLNEYF